LDLKAARLVDRTHFEIEPSARRFGVKKSGIVTFTVRGQDAVAVRNRLRERRVNVSSIGRRSTPLEFEQRGLDLVVRAAVHYFNTDEEVQQLVGGVREIAPGSR
jgi:cysteine desulfurase / selenocysteine lyase